MKPSNSTFTILTFLTFPPLLYLFYLLPRVKYHSPNPRTTSPNCLHPSLRPLPSTPSHAIAIPLLSSSDIPPLTTFLPHLSIFSHAPIYLLVNNNTHFPTLLSLLSSLPPVSNTIHPIFLSPPSSNPLAHLILHAVSLPFQSLLFLTSEISIRKPFSHIFHCRALYTASNDQLRTNLLLLPGNKPRLATSLQLALKTSQTPPSQFLRSFLTREGGLQAPTCMYNYRASECESPGNASFKIPIFIADGSPLVGLPNLARVTSPCRVSGWILGARKAGTSSLYTYLARHPGVHATKLRGAPGDGELRYKFAAGADAADLAAGYNAILGEDVNEKGMIFDSSVGRLVRDPAGLVTACGSVNGRFAVVLREPVARCYSQMMMRVRLGSNGMSVRSNLTRIVERDLDEFLRTTKGGTDWMEGGKPSLLFNSSKNCIYEGVYAAHLKRWLFYVAREQIHVLFNEDLERAGMAEFKQLLRFFNLDESVYDYSEIGKRYNAAPVVAEERDNLRFSALLVERMSRVFAPYNLALTQLFNLHPPWSF